MVGDLHLHSHYSDGSSSIVELIDEARRRGLSYAGVVDHDTTAGASEALTEGPRLGVKALAGVEISAYDFSRGRKVHILGYGYRLPAPSIEALCRPTLDARHEMTVRQIELLAKAGYPVSFDEVAALAQRFGLPGPECRRPTPPALYKQHIMALLVSKGVCDAIYAPLYRKLFKGAGVAAGEIDYVDARDAVRAVREDGGRDEPQTLRYPKKTPPTAL